MQEIFRNDFIQILYDALTDKVSIGFYGKNLTEFEKLVVSKIIKEKK